MATFLSSSFLILGQELYHLTNRGSVGAVLSLPEMSSCTALASSSLRWCWQGLANTCFPRATCSWYTTPFSAPVLTEGVSKDREMMFSLMSSSSICVMSSLTM